MAEGGQHFCLSPDEVITFLTSNPKGNPCNYQWPRVQCLLMMAKNISGEVIPFYNGCNFFKFRGEQGSGSLAETQAIGLLRNHGSRPPPGFVLYPNNPPLPYIADIMFIVNYCPVYTNEIIQYCNEYPSIRLIIYFAGLYKNSIGALRDLMSHPQITIHNIRGPFWKSLILASPFGILDSFWIEPMTTLPIWVRKMQEALTARGMANFTVNMMYRQPQPVFVISEVFLDARKTCDDDNTKMINDIALELQMAGISI